MNILAIETSCDETAISLVRATGEFPVAHYEIQGNAIFSQIDIHAEYGGVFPTMAKREHAARITQLSQQVLKEAELLESGPTVLTDTQTQKIAALLDREPQLTERLFEFLAAYERPDIDMIAVTTGPGLEPALWVGVNFAKALAIAWNIPVAPVNHMEGHILASLYDVVEDEHLAAVRFPALALLVSGGHTELIHMPDWGDYHKIGQTRDDAVGEAFDKVARLLGLPYPGGPALSKLAAKARKESVPAYKSDMPRPMRDSGDLDFSFSGIKTSVRYAIADKTLSGDDKQALARDFEDAVVEVLVHKTLAAINKHQIQTVIIGGGVSANQYLRDQLQQTLHTEHPDCELYLPRVDLSTDNSIMIALAGHAKAAKASNVAAAQLFRADGNLSL